MRRWMSCRALCNIFSTVWRRGGRDEGREGERDGGALCIRTDCLRCGAGDAVCSAGGAGAGPERRGRLD